MSRLKNPLPQISAWPKWAEKNTMKILEEIQMEGKIWRKKHPEILKLRETKDTEDNKSRRIEVAGTYCMNG